MPTNSTSAIRLASLALTLVAIAPATHAQPRAARALSVGVGGGGTLPVGDFAKDVKAGGHGFAWFQYQPVTEGPWAVRAETQYHLARYTDDFLVDVGATPDDDLRNTLLYVGVSATYHVKARSGVRPYVVGGLGLYQVTATLTGPSGISTSDSEAGFGFSGGAGLRLGGAMGVVIEARFHQFSISPAGGEKSTSQLVPLSIGFAF